MGYNAVVCVLLDRLDEIERDPEFGKKLSSSIRCYDSSGQREPPYVTGQTTVISVQHADVMQVTAIGANYGRVLGYGYWKQDDIPMLKQILKDLQAKQKKKTS